MPRKAVAAAAALCCGAWGVSALLLDRLAESFPLHWDIHGRPDSFGEKDWAAFFLPCLMTLLAALARQLPRLAPGRYAPAELETTYPALWLAILALLSYLHAVALGWGLGVLENTGRALGFGLFAFIGAAGFVLGRVEPGYRLGFRTPWTVRDPAAWTATHRFAGRAMPAGALLGLAGSLAGAPFPPLFALALLCLLAPAAYSLFRRQ